MAKNILIFSDGTGQAGGLKPEQRLSNIYKLYRATKIGPDSIIDPQQQVAYYDAGVGSDLDDKVVRLSKFKTVWKFFSMATGTGISRNIADCYEYILKVYEPGDRIYLFGFSRGAYTVRCLGGQKRLMQAIGATVVADNGDAGLGFAHARILRFFLVQNQCCTDIVPIIPWRPYVLFDLCCGGDGPA